MVSVLRLMDVHVLFPGVVMMVRMSRVLGVLQNAAQEERREEHKEVRLQERDE